MRAAVVALVFVGAACALYYYGALHVFGYRVTLFGLLGRKRVGMESAASSHSQAAFEGGRPGGPSVIAAIVDPVTGSAAKTITIPGYEEIYRALGVPADGFSAWLSESSEHPDRAFLDGFPALSELAWAQVEQILMLPPDLERLRADCTRASTLVTHVAAKKGLQTILDLAAEAEVRSFGIRFEPG